MKLENSAEKKHSNEANYYVQEYRKMIVEMLHRIDDEKFLRSITVILKSYIEKRGC